LTFLKNGGFRKKSRIPKKEKGGKRRGGIGKLKVKKRVEEPHDGARGKPLDDYKAGQEERRRRKCTRLQPQGDGE